jgi:histone H3/H4
MSGRGKGRAGLGKGGAKRHRRVLRDTSQGISKGSIRRLARRGGVKRISSLIYNDVRGALTSFLGPLSCAGDAHYYNLVPVILDAATYADYRKRRTITFMDVLLALKRRGTTLYFTERFSSH